MEREAIAISGAYVKDEIVASQFYPVLDQEQTVSVKDVQPKRCQASH